MLTKHSLLAISLLCTSQLYANIPIEAKNLTQGSTYRNNAVNAVSSATPSTVSNTSWELIQQNQRLENQIRALQGKLEEQEHQIEQLSSELKNRYTDLDQRLELLQQKIDPVEEETNSDDTAPAATSTTNPSSTTTLSPPTTASSNLIAANTTVPPSSASSNQDELDKAAYTIALDAYKQGGAKKAIAPMQNFIRNNPNSVYTGNAYFWLAEFNLAVEPPNYEEAQKNYEIVVSKFQNSGKAPRALYQLYSIAKEVSKNTQTAEIYKKRLLNNYPNSEEATYFKNS